MFPGMHAALMIAGLGLAGSDVPKAKQLATSLTTTYDNRSRSLVMTCDGPNRTVCPIQIERGVKRFTLPLPAGKTVRIPDARRDTRVCFANDEHKLTGCPKLPPPPMPPPRPKRRPELTAAGHWHASRFV